MGKNRKRAFFEDDDEEDFLIASLLSVRAMAIGSKAHKRQPVFILDLIASLSTRTKTLGERTCTRFCERDAGEDDRSCGW